MRRIPLLLSTLALTAALQAAEALPPVLVTFRQSAQTLTNRWWKKSGKYVWNGVTATGAADLLSSTATGETASSGISLTCAGTICGDAGRLTVAQFGTDREKDFPKGVVTTNPDTPDNADADNGWVLNGSGSCSLTLDGLKKRAAYTLYVLAGRGNVWSGQDSATTYSIDAPNATLDYAENASGQASLTQNTSDGNWLVFAYTFSGVSRVTVTGTGGAGNFNAFALEEHASELKTWKNPAGGAWADEANWANPDAEGEPWLSDLKGAIEEVVITYGANPEPEVIRWDASATRYALAGETFGAAFVDGEVVKDGEGVVTLRGANTCPFYVQEGTLAVAAEGSVTGTVTVGAGAAVAGAGKVGTVVFQDGAVYDASLGALTAEALAPEGRDLLSNSLPVGVTPPAPTATVTVRGAKAGVILKCGTKPEGLTFVSEDGGTLTWSEEGGLQYAPKVGYRLRFR